MCTFQSNPIHLALLNQILHIYISFNLTLCDLCTGSSAVFQLASQPLWTIRVSRLLVGCLLFLQLLKGCNFPIGLLPVFEISKSIGVSPKISAPTLWQLNWSQPIPPRSGGIYSPKTSHQNKKQILLEYNILNKNILSSCSTVFTWICSALQQLSAQKLPLIGQLVLLDPAVRWLHIFWNNLKAGFILEGPNCCVLHLGTEPVPLHSISGYRCSFFIIP